MDMQHKDLMQRHATASEALDERLARLEHLLTAQQEHIARLEAAQMSASITTAPLPTPLSVAPEHHAGGHAAPEVAPPPVRPGRRSRRALLKLGGAAAAASVAAAAAAVTSHDTAQASGIAWQTGVVNSDVQTFVEPANGSFPDPTLLTVRLGTAAPYQGLSAANSAAIAAYDTTVGAIGLYATSTSGTGVTGRSDSSAGVQGISNSWFGVAGSSGSGMGVRGSSFSSDGVNATSTNGNGVAAFSFSSGNGVAASSTSGNGVSGSGGRYGGIFSGAKAPLLLTPSGSAGAPSSGTHSAGEFYLDSATIVWVCTAGGTPGTWVRLTGVHSGTPGGALNYLPAPIRLFDTRSDFGQGVPLPVSKGALAGQSTTPIQVTGTIQVPAGATGVFGNLTVSNTQGGGDLILYPSGAPQPNASNINYVQGQTIANSFNVGLSTGGAMDLFVHVHGTDVIIDISGYVM